MPPVFAAERYVVAVDVTLFKRTGRKMHAIGWFHDTSAKGPHQVGLGSNWVIAAWLISSPQVGQGSDLRRPVVDSVVADDTCSMMVLFQRGLIVTGLRLWTCQS